MSEISLLYGVIVVILATLGEIGILFSVCNILKNYLTSDAVLYGQRPLPKKGVFSSPVSHLKQHIFFVKHKVWSIKNYQNSDENFI